jgi:AmmeMemoRadiSam system protein B
MPGWRSRASRLGIGTEARESWDHMPAATRRAAVAGSWYPASPSTLRAEVDRYLEAVSAPPIRLGEIIGLIAPHAGLKYSGHVAAYAYAEIRGRGLETVVLVGPSHFVGFDGVAAFDGDGFETPLGVIEIDREFTSRLIAATPLVRGNPAPHRREHSLEMQLPFLSSVAPNAKIVALLIGSQTAEVAEALAAGLRSVAATRRALLVASSDLSHYYDAGTAAKLDTVVIERVRDFDPDGLQRSLDLRPEHACGGGPIVAVMRAARLLGANEATVLKYADSGDISGDKSAVVGYLAAAFGTV